MLHTLKCQVHCFTLSIKTRLTKPFNSSQDVIPKITPRDAKACMVRRPQLDILQYR